MQNVAGSNKEIYEDGCGLLDALSLEPENKNIWLDGLFNKWFRLNTFYDIKNVSGKQVQFRSNDAQTSYFVEMHTRDVILKARQLGFTTFKMIYDLDDCLFIDNYSAACVAHTLEAVKSIFDDKIKFAYKNINHDFISVITGGGFCLPTPSTDRANEYKFSNGSKISVGTGYRSGTLQSLHVSEFGKICKKYPDRAKEVITGSFEAVSEQGTITVESTAEGREGRFFDLVQKAKSRTLFTPLSFKLKFYSWHENPRYKLDEGSINPNLEPYFDKLALKFGIGLTREQKLWYSAKWDDLGEDIYREYPSYPDEAFKVSIDGAYYARQFADIYKERRIGDSLNDHHDSVCTAWDIGTSDSTAIWFYEIISNEIHIIDYYENSGLGLSHYLKVVNEKPYSYKSHNGPHDMNHRQYANEAKTLSDIAREGLTCDEDKGTEKEGTKYKLDFNIVPISSINEGIENVRNILPKCYFYEIDDSLMSESEKKQCINHGVKCLESYRKQWNDKVGDWKDSPLHDWSSHGSDAFRILANAESKKEHETLMINSVF